MNECEVVRDLIPLYAENIASNGSRRFVESHTEHCSDCRAALDTARDNKIIVNAADPLKTMKRGFRRYTAEVAALVVTVTLAALLNGWVYCIDPADEMGLTLPLMYVAISLCGLICGAVLGARRGWLKWLLPLFCCAANISACLSDPLRPDMWIVLLLSFAAPAVGMGVSALIRRSPQKNK
ncbi:MAG: zf-HC2 domain-containing protein [Oscillospiraceae bacterium]|nr:zf-HC2 domain-containing protein [Oscillospiraceae bacterium]